MSDDELRIDIARNRKYVERYFDFTHWHDNKAFNGDLKLQCEFMRTYKSLLREYPLSGNKIQIFFKTKASWIGACYPMSRDVASNGNTYLNFNLGFNNSSMSSYRHIVHEIKTGADISFYMPCSPESYAKYAMIHEYGHIYQSEIIKNAKRKLNTKGMKDEIVEIYKEQNPGESYIKDLSFYGDSNKCEFFAETFANMLCGSPNKLGIALKSWLEKEGL